MAFVIPSNFRSSKDVGAPARAVATALHEALDESVTAWFEPPYDVAGERPHFAVFAPDAGVVLLELLEARTSTKLFGVIRGAIRIQRDGQEVDAENPLARAEKRAEKLRKLISSSAQLRALNIPIGSGAVFPGISRKEAEEKQLGKVVDLKCCLFQDDLQKALDDGGDAHIRGVFRHCLPGRLPEPLTQPQQNAVKAALQPETVIGATTSDATVQLTIFRAGEDDKDLIRVMDRRQEDLAKTMGEGHRLIRGVAGSGKTLVLLNRARLLARLHPRKKFLVTCYTKALAAELRKLLVECSNVDVHNLDALMWQVTRDARLKSPGYDADPTGDQVAAVALEALGKAPRRYDGVFLDEAQDFGTTALKFVVGLLGSEDGDLLIVADSAQNIFRRKFSWKDAGVKAQGRSRILRTNYRNTQEILEFAGKVLRGEPGLTMDASPDEDDASAVILPEASLRKGSRPTVIGVEGDSAAAVEIAKYAAAAVNGAARPRTVAVIHSGSLSFDAKRMIEKELGDRGLPCFTLAKDNKDNLHNTGQPVVLTTVQSAKGLEFPHVVVCGDWLDRETNLPDRRRLYVAMTRATDTLALVLAKGNPLLPELA